MIFKVVQVIVALGSAFALFFYGEGELVVHLKGLVLIPSVVVLMATLGVTLPKVFSMGVQGQRKAGPVRKILPIIYLGLVIYAISLMPQTYASSAFVSILIGNGLSYLGYYIASLIPVNKKKK